MEHSITCPHCQKNLGKMYERMDFTWHSGNWYRCLFCKQLFSLKPVIEKMELLYKTKKFEGDFE